MIFLWITYSGVWNSATKQISVNRIVLVDSAVYSCTKLLIWVLIRLITAQDIIRIFSKSKQLSYVITPALETTRSIGVGNQGDEGQLQVDGDDVWFLLRPFFLNLIRSFFKKCLNLIFLTDSKKTKNDVMHSNRLLRRGQVFWCPFGDETKSKTW